MEIWKDIKGYEGCYQVSNFGEVKSLDRLVNCNKRGSFWVKEKILKKAIEGGGYYQINLSKNGKLKARKIHQLVAESFLNHMPCGYKLVVNHKDFNKLNNNVENLEIVTQRENANRKHLKSSSKYTGVCWSKRSKKWKATIIIKSKNNHLGFYNTELEAYKAYQKALKLIINN